MRVPASRVPIPPGVAIAATRMGVTITLPLRLDSEANRSRSEHWTVTRARVALQRDTAGLATYAALARLRSSQLPHVRVVRIAPRALDPNVNLPRSMKAIEDGIADALGIDDKHLRVDFDQERGAPKVYAVRIELTTVVQRATAVAAERSASCERFTQPGPTVDRSALATMDSVDRSLGQREGRKRKCTGKRPKGSRC